MKKLVKRLNTYQLYTILFVILCIGVFFSFIKNGRSFIWYTDGFKQHYIFLENFHQTIRNASNGISTFSWSLGLGLDKIGQLSYYTLGDPFAYISLLFPIENLKYAYSILVLVRIYCVGLSFIAYCNYHKKSKFATLVGTLIYTFSGYILYAAVRHPFFANAAIWLPLMFLGIDKILKEGKYKLFTIMSAVSAISNYYFFYMITILTFIYAIIKYWNEFGKKGAKLFWTKFIKTTICYIIGVLSASILLLPTIYAFANNSRSIDIGFTYYNFDYYLKLFFMSTHTPFWTRVYVSPLVLVLLPIAILNFKKNKENRTWLINLLIQTIILLIPFLGSVMNGFSFQSNRWTFGFCFGLAYLVTINLRNDLTYSPREFKFTKKCLLLYFVLWFFFKSHVGIFSAITILLAFVFLIILLSRSLDYPEIKKNQYFQYAKDLKSPKSQTIKARVKVVLIFFVCVNILLLSWQTYSHGGYSKEFEKYETLETLYANLDNDLPHFSEAIKYIQDTDSSFYRIATSIPESNNEAYKYGFNGLNTYMSVGNKYVTLLSRELNILNNAKTNSLREFDSRTRITSLLGSKYYITTSKKSNYVPYGYTLINEIKNEEKNENTTQIYKNKYTLPIGVFYNNYTLKQDYDSLSSLEKEQALLKTAVIENTDDISNYNINSDKNILNNISTKTVSYSIIDPKGIVNQDEKKITPKKDKDHFKINIEDTDVTNCELYLLITNQKYSKTSEYSITAKYNKVNKKQLIRDKVTSPYYIETPDILFNLGYKEEHSKSISIVFDTTDGEYTYDDIKLIAVPIDNYKSDIENFKKYPFKLEESSDDRLYGTISNSEDGILQISTSYSSGWTAYVDGNKTDIINVNTGFIGIPLFKGTHKVELVYSTPYLNLGIKLSLIGIILIIIVFIINTILIKKRKKK